MFSDTLGLWRSREQGKQDPAHFDLVLSWVHFPYGPPFLTNARAEPFSAIPSAFLPGMGLSLGMGMV